MLLLLLLLFSVVNLGILLKSVVIINHIERLICFPHTIDYLLIMRLVNGVGIDIVQVERISTLLQKYGLGRLASKLFSVCEYKRILDKYQRTKDNDKTFKLHLAGRIAAKEAVFKAVSSQQRLGWKEIEIISEERSTPSVSLLSNVSFSNILLSISHDGDYAVAMAMAFVKKQ